MMRCQYNNNNHCKIDLQPKTLLTPVGIKTFSRLNEHKREEETQPGMCLMKISFILRIFMTE